MKCNIFRLMKYTYLKDIAHLIEPFKTTILLTIFALVQFIVLYSLILSLFNKDCATTLDSHKKNVIMVFGGGVETKTLTPTKTLEMRLKKGYGAYKVYKAQYMVLTGGIIDISDSRKERIMKPKSGYNIYNYTRDDIENISEAFVMQTFLEREYSLNKKFVILETNSSSTFENLLYTERTLSNLNITADKYNLIFVSSSYHIPRIIMLANRLNIENYCTIKANIPLSANLNLIREFIATIKSSHNIC